jgi:hypothetical protein
MLIDSGINEKTFIILGSYGLNEWRQPVLQVDGWMTAANRTSYKRCDLLACVDSYLNPRMSTLEYCVSGLPIVGFE